MASFLLMKYVRLFKDLHSCTLVSRYWCKISTPLLYSCPFHKYSFDEISHFKLIRTLLSCIPQPEIKEIYTSYTSYALLTLLSEYIPFTKKNSYSEDILSMFNYISFIRGLLLTEFFCIKTAYKNKKKTCIVQKRYHSYQLLK